MEHFKIETPSLSKRWFGYRTECGKLASFAVLVHYEVNEGGGMKAYVYLTSQLIVGKVSDVLSEISAIIDCEFEKKLKRPPPPKDRAFYTQAWQGEERKIADGKIFQVNCGQNEKYTPPWLVSQ